MKLSFELATYVKDTPCIQEKKLEHTKVYYIYPQFILGGGDFSNRVPLSIDAHSTHEAEEKIAPTILNFVHSEAFYQLSPPPKTCTVREYFNIYWIPRHWQQYFCNQRAIDEAKQKYQFMLNEIGSLKLIDFKADAAQAFYDTFVHYNIDGKKRNHPLSTTTAKRYVDLYMKAFNDAQKEGFIYENPFTSFKDSLVTTTRKKKKIKQYKGTFTESEIEIILAERRNLILSGIALFIWLIPQA